jgi:hypothetical protein
VFHLRSLNEIKSDRRGRDHGSPARLARRAPREPPSPAEAGDNLIFGPTGGFFFLESRTHDIVKPRRFPMARLTESFRMIARRKNREESNARSNSPTTA